MSSLLALLVVLNASPNLARPPLVSDDAPLVESVPPRRARVLRAVEGKEPPPGYRLTVRPNLVVTIVGAGVFVATWVISSLVSAVVRLGAWVACGTRVDDCGIDPNRQPLAYVPLVGPVLAAPAFAPSWVSTGLQALGLAATLVGLTFAQDHIWVLTRVEVSPTGLVARF